QDFRKAKPENNLLRAGVISGLLVVSGIIIYQSGVLNSVQNEVPQMDRDEIIVLQPADALSAETIPPKLKEQSVIITYPAYTGIPACNTTNTITKALEGSRITCIIQIARKVDSAQMESMGNRYPMRFQEESFSRTAVLNSSGFYNFRFKDNTGGSFVSDLYSIDVSRDRAPEIEIQDLQQFTSFNYDEDKRISFNTIITDNYGVAEAYIIATMSKGTGESDTCREEKLEFETGVKRGEKTQELVKK